MNASMSRDEALRLATRHLKLRWVGAPLFLTGASLLVMAVRAFLHGASGWTVLLACFGTGMGLASFGSNHDAALAYAYRLHRDPDPGPGLTPALSAELNEEMARDRTGVGDLIPFPKMSMIVPFVAIAVQTWVFTRLFGG